MTTHLSIRLAWHDRGWDGHVCDNPRANSACMVIGSIRENRVDAEEVAHAGKHVGDLKGWLPPCSRDIGAWSARSYDIEHADPLSRAGLLPTVETIPAYGTVPSPYRWMNEANLPDIADAEGILVPTAPTPKTTGWVYEPDRQAFLLKHFWGKLKARKSLLFYYCKEGTPMDEDAPRVIVGVGRLREVGEQQYFTAPNGGATEYPIWSRAIQPTWPKEGVRLPYQEYLRAGHPTDAILCRVPGNHTLDFSYVAEHLSDDLAVSMLERVIQCVQQVQADGKVAGDWERQLLWLNDVLAEVWTERGPYPGIGSVLQYLGCQTGTAYQRLVLAPSAGQNENPWDFLRGQLDGVRKIAADSYFSQLLTARERWQALKSQQPLLELLARFELTTEQVRRFADSDRRRSADISATDEEILANPYVLVEQDFGEDRSAAVSLEVIDHGMLPEGQAAGFAIADQLAPDDRRRVRAVAFDVLRHAADNGDTLLPWDALWDGVERKFPDRRECKPNRQLVAAEAPFYREVLDLEVDGQVKWGALKHLRAHEAHIAGAIRRRSAKTNDASKSPPDWHKALLATFRVEPTEDREREAWDEKKAALDTLFTRRVSVLTGGAGTGKTSVLRAFLSELERVEGKQPRLLLAPTGKARVRMSKATGLPAQTIHQLLMRGGWLTPDFRLLDRSDKPPVAGVTVVIDECSMIPTDLFGALLKAIDLNTTKRLILVGDPYQLPPIGPGRPFVDIFEWLRQKAPECLAELRTCMRVDVANGQVSQGLQLATGYRDNEGGAGDDEILAALARGQTVGDVTSFFWRTPEELDATIDKVLHEQLGIQPGDYAALDASLGFGASAEHHEPRRAENWQILSPTRGHAFGTDASNRRMQLSFRKKLLEISRDSWKQPKPFGDQEIVWSDKVINVQNHGKKGWAWPQNPEAADYVANGEIGLVTSTSKGKGGGDSLNVMFATQERHSYRYWRSWVEGRLELAYALTVHKAQGSDFETAIVIIPKNAATLSRELLYTALTRFRQRLVLLIEQDIEPLIRLRNPITSATRLRNTFQFELLLRPNGVGRPYAEALIHRTSTNIAVRSKSEVIVANTLTALGISYQYEQRLFARDNDKDFRLPDFTVSFDGDTYYWEHLGMLNLPQYKRDWERKKQWYADNGFADLLLTSEDGLDGSIDAAAIEKLARRRILAEE